jgi:hypothetical protein
VLVVQQGQQDPLPLLDVAAGAARRAAATKGATP